MELALQTFNQHRPRLMGIAYRMLGSRVDAEDILQDAYLRWHHTDTTTIDNPEAWLVTATTRLCIDKLRAVKTERERYIGPWVPEPIVSEYPTSPEQAAIMAGDISLAFLLTLERLAPEERAAFLLREVFDFEYGEIARVLTKNESACRQIVHRAKDRVQQNRPRFTVAADAHKRLLDRFIAVTSSGDEEQMLQLFADDIRMVADGGGKVTAALRVLNGGERVMRLYRAIGRRMAGLNARWEPANVNGEIGLLGYVDDKLDSVYSFVTDGNQIREIYVIRNPDKFTGVFSTHEHPATDNAAAQD